MRVPTKDFLKDLSFDATEEIQRKLQAAGFQFTDDDGMWGKLIEAIENALESIYTGADYINYN